MINSFAASDIHVNLPVETIFNIGPLPITNSMLLGAFGIIVMFIVFGYTVRALKRGKRNHFVGLVQWAVEGMYSQVHDIIPNRKIARSVAPMALTMFFVVLFTYWCAVLPGLVAITYDGKELFRELPSDLNFTFALAIISMFIAQYYAVKAHGFVGNIKRYAKNPFKDPIGWFEGMLEFIGEFSRYIALSLRLFGNAFAGAVLLMIVGIMTSWFASLTLPLVMIFELFIGFIQAYVFFVLTVIFTALATASHGGAHDSDHSLADTQLAESDRT